MWIGGILLAGTLSAGPVVFNLAPGNVGVFDNAIIATGASVQTIVVGEGQSAFTYINPDSSVGTLTVYRSSDLATPAGAFDSYGGITGYVWDISPASSVGDIVPGQLSGLTFVFSTPVNAFGFMVGDWATCCMDGARPLGVQTAYGVPELGSGLGINFQGGAFTLPANALTDTDNPGVDANGEYVNFIGAIDASGTFNTITFFGDGFGEYLVAGGTLRFGTVPIGSVGGEVPEPATFGLFALGLGLMVAWRRSRRTVPAATPAP